MKAHLWKDRYGNTLCQVYGSDGFVRLDSQRVVLLPEMLCHNISALFRANGIPEPADLEIFASQPNREKES